MASDDVGLSPVPFYDNLEYKRHPNNTKTDQLPISGVITGLPRPYHNMYVCMSVCLSVGLLCLSVLGRHLKQIATTTVVVPLKTSTFDIYAYGMYAVYVLLVDYVIFGKA